MENALRACCKGIKIGKILIHRQGNNGREVRQTLSLSLSPYIYVIAFLYDSYWHNIAAAVNLREATSRHC